MGGDYISHYNFVLGVAADPPSAPVIERTRESMRPHGYDRWKLEDG